jgi:hypothetical protein
MLLLLLLLLQRNPVHQHQRNYCWSASDAAAWELRNGEGLWRINLAVSKRLHSYAAAASATAATDAAYENTVLLQSDLAVPLVPSCWLGPKSSSAASGHPAGPSQKAGGREGPARNHKSEV